MFSVSEDVDNSYLDKFEGYIGERMNQGFNIGFKPDFSTTRENIPSDSSALGEYGLTSRREVDLGHSPERIGLHVRFFVIQRKNKANITILEEK